MTNLRPWARAGLSLLVLTAGALAVATVVDPVWRSHLLGSPASAAHGGAAPLAGTPVVAPSPSPPPSPPLAALSDPEPAGPGDVARHRSEGGRAVSSAPETFPPATSMDGSDDRDPGSGAALLIEAEAPVAGDGLRWPPRASSFAALAGAIPERTAEADFELPDEPTGAGSAMAAALPGGLMDLTGGGSAASFSATALTVVVAIGERRTQLPAHPGFTAGATSPLGLATAVPEPGSVPLMLLGLGALAAVAGRQRRRAIEPAVRVLKR